MREPPPHVTGAEVLSAVRTHWDADVADAEHLPVGFGAHHWRVSAAHASYFVTWDGLAPRHTAASLEGAYAAAAALASAGLEFVHAGLPAKDGVGAMTVAFADGALSVTPWLVGTSGDGSMSEQRARTTRRLLDRLHDAAPPASLPPWRPLVDPGLADLLGDRTATAWRSGPYGERARAAIRGRLPEIREWTAAYHRIAAGTDERTWVTTHGEPHTRNQVETADGVRLVDWESARLAPRERDLRTLEDAGHPQPDADPRLLAMFDLEWRLDEIAQYAAWFEAPHTGTDDDRIAIGGLLDELAREPRHSAEPGARD